MDLSAPLHHLVNDLPINANAGPADKLIDQICKTTDDMIELSPKDLNHLPSKVVRTLTSSSIWRNTWADDQVSGVRISGPEIPPRAFIGDQSMGNGAPNIELSMGLPEEDD